MPGVLVKLKSLQPSLSKTEKAVAGYILRHSAKVPYQSVYEVAKASGVSIASVIRLSQKAGYTQFKAFKVELGQDIPSDVTDMYQAIGPEDADESIIRKVALGNARSLEDTLKVLDFSHVIGAAKAIGSAARVVFFGTGGSGNVGRDAALQFAQIRVQAESYNEPYEALIRAAGLGKGDVAVGISNSGRTATTLQCLELARKAGAVTVGISNYLGSPLRKASDYFLCTAFPKGRYEAVSLSARIAQFCLIDMLYLLVVRHRKAIGDVRSLDRMIEDRLRVPEQ